MHNKAGAAFVAEYYKQKICGMFLENVCFYEIVLCDCAV